jgi:hypothetical protein
MGQLTTINRNKSTKLKGYLLNFNLDLEIAFFIALSKSECPAVVPNGNFFNLIHQLYLCKLERSQEITNPSTSIFNNFLITWRTR